MTADLRSAGESRWRDLPGGGEALVHLPDGEPRGAVLVLGELFGMTDIVDDSLARLARAGYAGVAPDLHWRVERRLALPYDDAGRRRGFDLLAELDLGDAMDDLARALGLGHDLAPGVTGIVGFSVGGHIGLHAAARMRVDMVAAVYAGWTLGGEASVRAPAPPLHRAQDLAGTRVLVVAGSQDPLVEPDLVGIATRLGDAGVEHTVRTLTGVGHGYACRGRPKSYAADATEETWRLVLDALAQGSSVAGRSL